MSKAGVRLQPGPVGRGRPGVGTRLPSGRLLMLLLAPAFLPLPGLAAGEETRQTKLVLPEVTLDVKPQMELRFEGHEDAVRSIAFSPDGSLLACGTQNGVRPYDARTGKERVALFHLADGDDWLATTPEGYFDGSLGACSLVAWRLGERSLPFDQFEAKYCRPDLVRRALAGEEILGASPMDASQVPPLVAFTAPGPDSAVSGRDLTVVLQAGGVHAVERIELTVNGRLPALREVRTAPTGDPRVKEFAATIALPPNEARLRLRAVAYDSEGLKSSPVEMLLRRSDAAADPGRLFIVSIGISRYGDAAWSPLGYADADAAAFAAALPTGQLRPADRVQTRVLVNEKATASGVKLALRSLKDTCGESDVAAVFLAGHGVKVGEGAYYFLCHDSTPAELGHTALGWDELERLLREVRGRYVLLFADTCHAGHVTGPAATEGLVHRMNRKAGVLVFAASRGGEPSIERDEWRHGAFTRALLDGLAGAADRTPGDGRITLQELRTYVTWRVIDLTQGQQHPYFPRMENLAAESIVALVPRAGAAAPVPTPAAAPRRPVLDAPPAKWAAALSEKVPVPENVSLAEFLEAALKPRGIAYRVDPEVLGKRRVRAHLEPRSLEAMLRLLLQMADASGRWEEDALVIESVP